MRHSTPLLLAFLTLSKTRFRRRPAAARTRIFAEVPAYERLAVAHPAFVDDVRSNTAHNLEVMTRSIREGRPVTADELLWLRAPVTRRARMRLLLHSYLHSYRVGHRVAWLTLVSGVNDDRAKQGALSLVVPVMEFINITSTYVAEVYLEVEQLLFADGERVRRDLLEDLLSGHPPLQDPARRRFARQGWTETAR
jgi:hypothetical protein